MVEAHIPDVDETSVGSFAQEGGKFQCRRWFSLAIVIAVGNLGETQCPPFCDGSHTDHFSPCQNGKGFAKIPTYKVRSRVMLINISDLPYLTPLGWGWYLCNFGFFYLGCEKAFEVV
jgi:hypothetical protein